METIPTIRPCALCGQPGKPDAAATHFLALHHAPTPYQIMRCERCDFRWLDPTPNRSNIESQYSKDTYFERTTDDYSYARDIGSLKLCFTEQVAEFRRRCTLNGEILDIGCATGEFIELAISHHLRARGIEVSAYASRISQERGLPVLHGDLWLPELTPSSFDGARMSHVLEHVPDPVAALNRVRELLGPSGVLYVEVPYQFDGVLDLWARILRRTYKFGPFSLHHLSFFSPRSLSTLLENTGFRTLSLRTYTRCRRAMRRPTKRLAFLRVLLWLSDQLAKRGDVISVWAQSTKEYSK